MRKQTKQTATVALVILQFAVFLILSFGGMTEDAYYMLGHGAMYVPYILQGEYYRLFTSMFLHFGFVHLMNNMISLFVIGWNLEPVIGRVRLIAIFLLSGLGGNVVSAVFDILRRDYAVSAGASGAIFGLTGALLCLAIRCRGRVGNVTRQGMVLMVGISLYLGFTEAGVDNAAHVGGLLTGMLVSLLLCRKRHLERRTFAQNG